MEQKDRDLRAAATWAMWAGLAPIQCPEILEALKTDAYATMILICEVWGVTGGKYK